MTGIWMLLFDHFVRHNCRAQYIFFACINKVSLQSYTYFLRYMLTFSLLLEKTFGFDFGLDYEKSWFDYLV